MRYGTEPSASIVPPSVEGDFFLYIGSGAERDGDLKSEMVKLGGYPIINIDIKVGGYDHGTLFVPLLWPGSCILWVRNPPEFYSRIFGHTHPTRLRVGQTDRSYVAWAGLEDPAYLT